MKKLSKKVVFSKFYLDKKLYQEGKLVKLSKFDELFEEKAEFKIWDYSIWNETYELLNLLYSSPKLNKI